MNAISVASLLLTVAFAATTFAAAPSYKIIDRIKVQDGGFDYANFDPAMDRILMARTNFTTVIDTKTGKVKTHQRRGRAHGDACQAQRSCCCRSARLTRIVDAATDKVVTELPAGKIPTGQCTIRFSNLFLS
jgi:hypothetical protein